MLSLKAFLPVLLLCYLPGSTPSILETFLNLTECIAYVASVLEVKTEEEVEKIANDFLFVDVPRNHVVFIFHEYKTNTTVDVTSANVSSVINKNLPTIFIIHGWQSAANSSWVLRMADLLLIKSDYNVFSVDWSIDAGENYLHAASAVNGVAEILYDFLSVLDNLITNFTTNLHLIGHSLGAHVSGISGQLVGNNTIARITGLDPAGPLFELPFIVSPDKRLSPDDGKFVDVIHTTVGLIGVFLPYGDIDFYPDDGGPIQPECEPRNLSALATSVKCSHGFSHTYYSETILHPKLYPGVKCSNSVPHMPGTCFDNQTVYMGDAVTRGVEGSIYLTINGTGLDQDLE